MDFSEKNKLYETLEEKVSNIIGNYGFSQYGFVLDKRNISWGDTISFNLHGNTVSVPLKTYSVSFSEELRKGLSNEELVKIISSKMIQLILGLIKEELNKNNILGTVTTFEKSVKLILEGYGICIDDNFIYKIGIGTIM